MMMPTNVVLLMALLPAILSAFRLPEYDDDYTNIDKRFPVLLTCQTDLDCESQSRANSCCVVSKNGLYRHCAPLGDVGSTCNINSFQHPWIGQRGGQLCPCDGHLRCLRQSLRFGLCTA